jgi:4'-phosphopantetheinyl transferase
VPVLKKIQSGSSEICLWKITEHECDFRLPIKADESKQTGRNRQWLAGRAALDALDIDLSQVVKDDFGKPYLRGQGKHISMSHCNQYAAAITSKALVGIDVEEITPRIERISKRFVHDDEWEFIDDKSRLQMLYVLWSAKEALYKLYGRKAVDFKNHMIAKPFKLGKHGFFQMDFLKETQETYTIQYEIYDNHTLVWVEDGV